MQALFRSLTHYASHAGYIVVLAMLMKGDEWQALFVPIIERKGVMFVN